MLIRSYVRSADFNRVSHGKKISCSIDIPVVVRLAFRAVPFTDVQWQRFKEVTAVPTAFTTGEPPVNLHKGTSVPLAFIFELTYQLSPGCITDTECQLVVSYHILNRQVLNNDGLVITHQLSGQFMEKVFTAIRNLAMYTSNFNSCFVSVVRSFLLSPQGFLNSLEFSKGVV